MPLLTAKTVAIVMKVTEPLLGKGYTVCLDKYNNNPALAVFLKRHSRLHRDPQTEQESCTCRIKEQKTQERISNISAFWTCYGYEML
jgi:hypothetical protein